MATYSFITQSQLDRLRGQVRRGNLHGCSQPRRGSTYSVLAATGRWRPAPSCNPPAHHAQLRGRPGPPIPAFPHANALGCRWVPPLLLLLPPQVEQHQPDSKLEERRRLKELSDTRAASWPNTLQVGTHLARGTTSSGPAGAWGLWSASRRTTTCQAMRGVLGTQQPCARPCQCSTLWTWGETVHRNVWRHVTLGLGCLHKGLWLWTNVQARAGEFNVSQRLTHGCSVRALLVAGCTRTQGACKAGAARGRGVGARRGQQQRGGGRQGRGRVAAGAGVGSRGRALLRQGLPALGGVPVEGGTEEGRGNGSDWHVGQADAGGKVRATPPLAPGLPDGLGGGGRAGRGGGRGGGRQRQCLLGWRWRGRWAAGRRWRCSAAEHPRVGPRSTHDTRHTAAGASCQCWWQGC